MTPLHEIEQIALAGAFFGGAAYIVSIIVNVTYKSEAANFIAGIAIAILISTLSIIAYLLS